MGRRRLWLLGRGGRRGCKYWSWVRGFGDGVVRVGAAVAEMSVPFWLVFEGEPGFFRLRGSIG